MMTLWDAPKGAVAAIEQVDPSLEQPVLNRLMDIGIEPSQFITCLHKGVFGGPMVVSVADTVYSLEQAIARRIVIKPAIANSF